MRTATVKNRRATAGVSAGDMRGIMLYSEALSTDWIHNVYNLESIRRRVLPLLSYTTDASSILSTESSSKVVVSTTDSGIVRIGVDSTFGGLGVDVTSGGILMVERVSMTLNSLLKIDGDCVVTGPMTELFESEEDVIGVRNNNSLDKASAHDFGITITHLPPFGNGQQIPIQGFINAGLIASNNKQFWYDWHELNREAKRIKLGWGQY